MGRLNKVAVLSAALLLLSACSLREDAAQLYKQEAPLQVMMDVPETIAAGEAVTLGASLTQSGEPLDEADFVHFEIRKQDGTLPYPMEEAQALGDGSYQIDASFKTDGLYVLEVHAGSGGAIANPQYQFIVGELSEEEMESLKQGPMPDGSDSDAHH